MARMPDTLGIINADTILAAGTDKLQSFGMTFKKQNILPTLRIKKSQLQRLSAPIR